MPSIWQAVGDQGGARQHYANNGAAFQRRWVVGIWQRNIGGGVFRLVATGSRGFLGCGASRELASAQHLDWQVR